MKERENKKQRTNGRSYKEDELTEIEYKGEILLIDERTRSIFSPETRQHLGYLTSDNMLITEKRECKKISEPRSWEELITNDNAEHQYIANFVSNIYPKYGIKNDKFDF